MPINDKTWMEWSHKVLEELTTLNNQFEAMQEKQELFSAGVNGRFDHIGQKIETMSTLLNGNGTPEKGLVVRVDRLEQKDVQDLDVRVDRLEQSESRRMWMMRATMVACLGAIAATVASYYRK